MIAARLEPTIPPVRGSGARLEPNEDARTGGFEEALAEQEQVAAKDAPANVAEQPVSPPPLTSAPAALQVLVAEVLRPPTPMAPRDDASEGASEAETPVQAQVAAAKTSKPAALQPVSDASASFGVPEKADVQAADAVSVRPKSHLDEKGPEETRDVTIKNVSSSSHFAIGMDPVRQISHEVTRAWASAAPMHATVASPSDSAQPVKTLHLQLEPESLGTVTVRMKLSGGQLSLRIDVVEPTTLDMIRQEQDRLQKSLGPELERLEIRAAGVESPTAVSAPESTARPSADMGRGAEARGQSEQASGQERARDDRGRHEQGKRQGHDATETHRERRDSLRGLYL